MTRKHSKVGMIVRMARVNVCVNIFIANASSLIYKGYLNFRFNKIIKEQHRKWKMYSDSRVRIW